jgi:hypothetical protein
MIRRMLILTLLAVWAAPALSADVTTVLEKYQAIRPQEKELAIYQLDWAANLKEAKTRAAKEHRPILFILVQNSFGDLQSGHC